MPKSYEKLIGNIINWSNPAWEGNKVFKVVVANIDPDLGISLVNPDDPKDTFTCMHGPSSPLYHQAEATLYSPLDWEEIFKLTLDLISTGHFKVEDHEKAMKLSDRGYADPICVFTM